MPAPAPSRVPATLPPTPTRRSATTSSRYRLAPVDGLPPFAGGAVGFFGYDLVRTVEPLGAPNPDPIGLPDMALMVSDVLVVFDHMRHELTLLAYAVPGLARTDVDAAYARAAGGARGRARAPPRAVPSTMPARPRLRLDAAGRGERGAHRSSGRT